MEKGAFGVLVYVAILFVFGCTPKIQEAEFMHGKEAIQIHIKADPKLNLYNRKAHTLYVALYQISELKAFDRLTQDEAGLRKLLECDLFDPSVAAVNSKVIHAGENLTIKLDRAERAKYFVLVTGYFAELDNARMVRRHKIPLFKEKVSFWKNKYQCIPCVLEIEVSLGPNQIEYSKSINNIKGCSDECR